MPIQYLTDTHHTTTVESWPFTGHPWSGRDSQGYGRKIPTDYGARVNGRRYRVYAACISNVASLYITVRGQRLHLRDIDTHAVGGAA